VIEDPPIVSVIGGGRVYLRRCSGGECNEEAVSELPSDDASTDALRRWLEPMIGPVAASALAEAATAPPPD
jgi:hypothetical protein